MKLILVESPTKAKTISRFLGKDFQVEASLGHIRDLPEDSFGIDIKNNFEPEYVTPAKAKKTLAALKKIAKTAQSIILATDEDREGEAISWHLAEALGLNKLKGKKEKGKTYERIVFHEITETAIKEALKNPREIDLNLVNAQQARRILDRIVGYKLSPFLWRKVAQGLSAGRVQSVAVRLIVERERDIQNFKADEYWTITATLLKVKDESEKGKINEFEAILVKKNGEIIPKLGIKTKDEAEKTVKELENADYKVESVEQKEIKKNPLPPFTTSALQQEAWQRFKYPAKFTMSLAQQLYEKGFITYHRTDSLNLSESSLISAQKYISDNLGKDYWPGFPRRYKTKSKSAQEAHEAIRPTDPFINSLPAASVKEGYNEKAAKLYDLIWRRFLASQMSEAILDSTSIDVSATNPLLPATNHLLHANGQMLKFDGFLKIYPLKTEEIELPSLEKGEPLKLEKLLPEQHFTQPPARYSEATLIKALEKSAIGRPSTYAPILETIQTRGYVRKDEKKMFFPVDIGFLVSDVLVKHFPEIVDIGFTAKMEENLDLISQGKKEWVPTIKEFYTPFSENLKIKDKEVSKKDVMAGISKEVEGQSCPDCQSPLVVKISRYGKFYACSKYPECKYKKHLLVSLGIACPKCGQASLAPSERGEIVERITRKRKVFYGCSRWPDCDFAMWDKPTGENCQECGWIMGKSRWGKIKCSNKECSTNLKQDAQTNS
ncbi:MAG: type I DNA topoisomerase [bacterium]|nr:type I DNA topoisomerase [bacterium]